jgi:hypothetical protein
LIGTGFRQRERQTETDRENLELENRSHPGPQNKRATESNNERQPQFFPETPCPKDDAIVNISDRTRKGFPRRQVCTPSLDFLQPH